jgi:hypothetical protein
MNKQEEHVYWMTQKELVTWLLRNSAHNSDGSITIPKTKVDFLEKKLGFRNE